MSNFSSVDLYIADIIVGLCFQWLQMMTSASLIEYGIGIITSGYYVVALLEM